MIVLFQLLSDFPKQCGMECLYTVLSSAVFIRNHLVHYDDVLGSEPRYVSSLCDRNGEANSLRIQTFLCTGGRFPELFYDMS